MPTKSTSYDVASLAGVSQSAVSRVFSPGKSASPKMRAKILAAAKELNYKPNAIAQSLSRGRTRILGLVITQYAQENYPLAVQAASDILVGSEDSILIQFVDRDTIGDPAIARLLDYRVDAIICTANLTRNAATACIEQNVPLVIINRHIDVEGVDHVSTDHFASTKDIARRLSLTGSQRTAFIGGMKDNWVSQTRCAGFQEGCRLADLPEPRVIFDCFDYKCGYDAALQLAPRLKTLDAMVCINDTVAAGLMDALRFELSISVPGDIQVVGQDALFVSSLRAYQITTTQHPVEEMLKAASALAIKRIENPHAKGASITINSELIIRNTALSQMAPA